MELSRKGGVPLFSSKKTMSGYFSNLGMRCIADSPCSHYFVNTKLLQENSLMALQLFHPSESSPVSSCILEDPLESLAASTSTPQVLQTDFLRATGVHRAVSEPVLQLVAHSGLPQDGTARFEAD